MSGMSAGEDLAAAIERTANTVHRLVLDILEDPVATERFRELAQRAVAGDTAAWRDLATPPERLSDGMAEIEVRGTVRLFPPRIPSPMAGFGDAVRDAVRDAMEYPERGERLHLVATNLFPGGSVTPTTASELLSLFARSPDELALLTPAFEKTKKAVSQTTTAYTTATVLTLTTTGTISTVACTFTTTSTTTTTTTTFTTTSNWCT